MKRTTVQAGDKSFDYLAGDQFKIIELLKLLYVKKIIQNTVFNLSCWLLASGIWQNPVAIILHGL
jgi:hypothetical protein